MRYDAKMPPPLQQQRQDRIRALSAEANRLANIATDRNLRRFIESARRDADDAEFWLKQPNVERRPPILHIVDLIVDRANWRLTLAGAALTRFGPDAMMVGARW
jgi:hypothetical protein